ncbi:hypothetical protein RGQ29_006346 [Quercus rubra]|uniref:Zinc transporter 10 n=1 Tax=Quercus rubra TaxID=3512 RepID=A0AAN7IC46_QUERU|nr:hypothetical protein RGQ29_006346 [Quercus rubra]
MIIPQALSESNQYNTESKSCNDKAIRALPLKIIAIVSILVTSMIGVSLPSVTHLFIIVKSFARGIILATGFMHVLPDSFDMLRSNCLKHNPWHNFPFSGFVAMLSAVATLMVDSMATSIHSRNYCNAGFITADKDSNGSSVNEGEQVIAVASTGHLHSHHQVVIKAGISTGGSQLLRYQLGIVVHSVVIGLSLGASNNTCTIKGLVAALCFHQIFEGMSLGGCILHAEYKLLKKAIMVFFFSVTTPFGVAIGIALSKTYKENSTSALITVGLLNASSTGLLIYMALVDLLSPDFMAPKLQASIKLQIKCFMAVLFGAGGMSLVAAGSSSALPSRSSPPKPDPPKTDLVLNPPKTELVLDTPILFSLLLNVTYLATTNHQPTPLHPQTHTIWPLSSSTEL